MPRKHRPGRPCSCVPCSGVVPDDGTGCCASLPAADLPGSLTLTTYWQETDPDTGEQTGPEVVVDSQAISGPFVYHDEAIEIPIWGGGAFGGSSLIHSYSADRYYIAGPVCLTTLASGCVWFKASFPWSLVCVDEYASREVHVIIACSTANISVEAGENSDPSLVAEAAVPKVRLFLVSNYGQRTSPTSGGPPSNCDDDCPGGDALTLGLYDCVAPDPGAALPFEDDWTEGGKLRLVGGIETDRFADTVLYAVDCRPESLCYAVSGRLAGGLFGGGAVDIEGMIGFGECEVPEVPGVACTVPVTLIDYCPGDGACPEGVGSGFRSVESRDALGEVRGVGVLRWQVGDDGQCLSTSVTVPVRVPVDPENPPEPVSPYVVALHDTFEGAGTLIGTVEIVDCRPIWRVHGISPDLGRFRVCVAGCPEGALPDTVVDVVIRSLDGSFVYDQGRSTANEDGCAVVLIPLPPAGNYRVDVTTSPPHPGYTTGTTTLPSVALPGPNTTCEPIDLGTVSATIAETHVCTCSGPVQKCIRWDGNGDPVELDYVEGSDPPTWRGYEVTPAAYPYDVDGLCNGNPPGDTAIVVELEVRGDGEGGCEAEATRQMHQCECPAPGEPSESPCYNAACGDISPRLMANPAVIGEGGDPFEDPGELRSKAVLPITEPWGPLDPFPGLTFGGAINWTRHDGTPDPNACLSPTEAYTDATAQPCTTEGGLMMAATRGAGLSGIPDEPPLPSPLRMAGQLARTMGATARRAVRREPIRASEATQAARWEACRACDHFRASDRRCGKLDGCGCRLARKIPLAAASCPLKPPKWGPAPVPASPPPAPPAS